MGLRDLPEEHRDVMRLFGHGDRPGPLWVVLVRSCDVPRYHGSSPATRRAALRGVERVPPVVVEYGEPVVTEMVEERRRRWAERIERARADDG